MKVLRDSAGHDLVLVLYKSCGPRESCEASLFIFNSRLGFSTLLSLSSLYIYKVFKSFYGHADTPRRFLTVI